MKKNHILNDLEKEAVRKKYKLNLTFLGSKHIIAGIDPSLQKTGLVIMESDGTIICEKLITPKKLKGVERLQFIRNELLSNLKKYHVTVVSIESYSFSSRGRAMFNLGELGGVIRLALFDNQFPYFDVSPSSLKSFIAENGLADKEMMRKAVLRKYKLDISEDNICDAFSLARMGLVLGDAMPDFCEKGGSELMKRIRNNYQINLF
jgi:crossover junction endodeoxyribonuclease RuvC